MIRQRTWWKVAAVMAAMALVLGACGDDDDEGAGGPTTEPAESETTFPADSTMARIAEAGTMKVGVKFDQPGFGLKNPTSDEIEGFDVEIAKLIAEAIGEDVEIEFVESVSANREPFLENGTVDMVVATYTINDTRKQRVDFAGPYFVAEQDIMVKADDDTIKSVADLDGKQVCTVTGSTSEKNVRAAAPNAQITLFGTYSECASAMTDGRVVAVTTDNTILAGLVEASEGAFKLVGAPFSEEPYGIGIAKADDVFRDFINDRLEELFEDGDWADAFASTLGEIGLETPEPPEVDRYTATIEATTSSTTG